MSELRWQKSSFSDTDDGSHCVELSSGEGDIRHLRESDDPGIVVTTTTAKLHALILGAKAGEFDHLV
ncbi:DUF397 domain-containing protein [Streptomyces sp. FH025]|uniref:DUF397 domain-containing protein n=1 Tax=Streptomyces sp. FH025 TaxID=2815937 RepID=UPI001A9EA13D|nr:DUF397 domain-containing protein [Streptomyces sp. FH025]MBO1417816.1 DUF397 domain-containing protein [Streptomyces sp. FH025]